MSRSDDSGPTPTLSFRFGGALRRRLEDEASDLGISPGEHARRLVAATLQDENRLEVLRQIDELKGELSKLRSDLASTVEVVLLNVTQTTPDQVKKWVAENLRR